MKDIFCRIIEGEIPSSRVYEDEDCIVILDLSQLNKGHCLVIPKQHYETYLDCPDELLSHLSSVAKKIGNALMKAFGAKGVNILANCYPEAGQEVPHFHIHVIPRYEGITGGFALKTTPQDTSNVDFKALALEIAKAI